MPQFANAACGRNHWRRFLCFYVAAIAIALTATLAEAAQLTLQQFTRQLSVYIAGKYPGSRVTSLKLDTFILKLPDGASVNVYSGNQYKEYISNSDSETTYFNNIHQSIAPALETKKSKIDPKTVLPIIRPRAWLNNLAGGPSAIHVEQFAAGLFVVYAVSSEGQLRFLDKKALAEIGMARPRAIAVQNLRENTSAPSITRGALVSMVTHGGTTESSILLMDEFWRARAAEIDGDIVVAVPNRDVLLFTGSRDQEAIRQLRDVAAKSYSSSSYPLSLAILRYRNGRWSAY